jgi:hypothetical protein
MTQGFRRGNRVATKLLEQLPVSNLPAPKVYEIVVLVTCVECHLPGALSLLWVWEHYCGEVWVWLRLSLNNQRLGKVELLQSSQFNQSCLGSGLW